MSMGCEHAMAVMSEYLDGELDEAQKEQPCHGLRKVQDVSR